MQRTLWLAIATITLVTPVTAADLHEPFRRSPWASNCICKWLCDDYCEKPEPCVKCPVYCTKPDDYCKKPLPLAKLLCPPTYCDDYCPKPLPPLPCEVNPRCTPPLKTHY